MKQAVIALALAACADDSLSQVHAKLQLCADAAGTACAQPLDLGAFRVPDTHDAHLWARNLGDGLLEVSSVEVMSGPLTAGALPDRTLPLQAAELALRVTPQL